MIEEPILPQLPDFEEYIQQGEPDRRQRAENWQIAIGLQAVDGLHTSEYLQQTARQHIEGKISIKEVQELVKTYYVSKSVRTDGDNDTEEADRVAAVFTIKYLQNIGFEVNNDLFFQNSWYFRNALVRANYQNVQKNVDYSPQYLELFFRNLLMGEHNELRNRYLHIRWNTPTNTPTSTPSSTPSSSLHNEGNKFYTDNDNIKRVVNALGTQQMSVKELLVAVNLKDRKNFIEYSLNPAMKEGFVRMLYPENPKHPRQKYLLTVKGIGLFHETLTSTPITPITINNL